MPPLTRRRFISQWCVYEHPRDYPTKYVMRRWDIYEGDQTLYATDDVTIADTLELIRATVPPGLHRLPRFAEDDACIVEVWM
jgi:hypothetical protein